MTIGEAEAPDGVLQKRGLTSAPHELTVGRARQVEAIRIVVIHVEVGLHACDSVSGAPFLPRGGAVV
ncbi:hypothetical protein GCM10027421_29790 [Microbacterium shaanxiense]